MITSAEFVTLAKHPPFSGNVPMFLVWLNLVLERTTTPLTVADPDVRWLLGHREVPRPRELPFNLEKYFR